jgi:hypothetical protein
VPPDRSRPLAASALQRRATLRGGTRLLAVDGRSGGPTVLRSTSDVPAVSYGLPVGRLSGPTGDVLVVTETLTDADGACAEAAGPQGVQVCSGRPFGTPGTTLERLDGSTGAVRWSRDVGTAGAFAYPLGTDADGDGTADLVAEDVFGGRLAVLSGATGADLWERVDEDALPFLLGVERGVAVVAGLRLSSGEQGLSGELLLRRLSARDGRLLAEGSRPLRVARVDDEDSLTGIFLSAGPLADGDGDGARELLLSTVSVAYGFDGELVVTPDEPAEDAEPSSSAFASDLHVEPLLGGAALLSEQTDDVRFATPYGDLDGDGLADLLREVVPDAEPFDSEATALRVIDGAPLWRLTAPVELLPRPAGDQDGRPGSELLAVMPGDEPAAGAVQSLRGADLGLRWSTG